MRLGYRQFFLGEASSNQEQPLESVDQLFEDRIPNLHSDRPELGDLIKFSNKGDEIFIQSFDRLGKDLRSLNNLICLLVDKGASVSFLNERITFKPKKNREEDQKNMRILQAITLFEANIIKRRQSEGIQRARKLNKYKGRKSVLDSSKIIEEYKKVGKVSAVAKNLGVSRMSVYRLLKEHKNGSNIV